MNKKQILKKEIQNGLIENMGVLPNESFINDLTNRIYYNEKLSLCAVGSSLPSKNSNNQEILEKLEVVLKNIQDLKKGDITFKVQSKDLLSNLNIDKR